MILYIYLFDSDKNGNLSSSDTAVLLKFDRLYSLELYNFVLSNAIYKSIYNIMTIQKRYIKQFEEHIMIRANQEDSNTKRNI